MKLVRLAWVLGIVALVVGCGDDDDGFPEREEERERNPGSTRPELKFLAPSEPQVQSSVASVRGLLDLLALVEEFDAAGGLLEVEGTEFRVQIAADGTLSWPGPGVTLTAVGGGPLIGVPGSRNSITIGPVDPQTGVFPVQPRTPSVIVIGTLIRGAQWPAEWPPEDHWTIEAENQDGRLVGVWRRWTGEFEVARAQLR